MLRFGLIGCGRIGQTHAKQLAARGILRGVCDLDEVKANSTAEIFQSKAYHSIDDFFSNEVDLDLVAICTPNGLHSVHTIASLNIGAHVICEKPMALTTGDCQSMILASKVVNKRIFVVKQNRFNPPVQLVKNLISQGQLGKLLSAGLNCYWNRDADYYNDGWRGTLDLDGGTLFTQFSHFIDLLLWLFGEVTEIRGFSGNQKHHGIIEFEDTGVISLKFRSGLLATVNYTVNAYRKNMEGSLTIFGDQGTIKIGGQYLNKLDYAEIKGSQLFNLPTGNPANNYGNYTGSMSNHSLVYDNVVNVLNNEAEMITTPEEGMQTVDLITRIYEVIRKNNG